jgi:phosphoglycolate phosphatase-like HAD superfamily hydrolase
MKNESVEVYLKGRVSELLNRVEKFEKRIISDREEFAKTRKGLQDHKKNNPNGSYEDVKDNLRKLMDLHYYSFLMEQNLQHNVNTILELSTMANFFDINLGLEGDRAEAMKNISNAKPDIFTINDLGEVVLADDEFKNMISQALESKKVDNNNLKDMYETLPL